MHRFLHFEHFYRYLFEYQGLLLFEQFLTTYNSYWGKFIFSIIHAHQYSINKKKEASIPVLNINITYIYM